MDRLASNQDHSLLKFEEKYKLWRSWCSLSPNEPNSIDRQLLSLISNDLQFRVISEARTLGNRTLESPMLQRCLQVGYATTQMIGIRRLTDKDGTPKRGVVSLKRLSNEIRKHLECFTRHNYICHGGHAYELAAESLEGSADEHGFIADDSPMDRWIKNRSRHERFDRICGKDLQTRKPADLPDRRLLEEVDRLLDDKHIHDIQKQVNKFVAHSADAVSRESLSAQGISLDRIADVHRRLIRAESVLVDFLLFPENARDATLRPALGVLGELANGDREKTKALFHEWEKLAAERNAWRISKEEISTLSS